MILVDSGVLYALADQDDDWHGRATGWLRSCRDLLLVPASVVPEVTYLLHARLGSDVERRFVASLAAGELALELVTIADVRRSVDLMTAYPEIGFVDASVVAIGERLKASAIATTDRRHFGIVRPIHRERFQLVP